MSLAPNVRFKFCGINITAQREAITTTLSIDVVRSYIYTKRGCLQQITSRKDCYQMQKQKFSGVTGVIVNP